MPARYGSLVCVERCGEGSIQVVKFHLMPRCPTTWPVDSISPLHSDCIRDSIGNPDYGLFQFIMINWNVIAQQFTSWGGDQDNPIIMVKWLDLVWTLREQEVTCRHFFLAARITIEFALGKFLKSELHSRDSRVPKN